MAKGLAFELLCSVSSESTITSYIYIYPSSVRCVGDFVTFTQFRQLLLLYGRQLRRTVLEVPTRLKVVHFYQAEAKESLFDHQWLQKSHQSQDRNDRLVLEVISIGSSATAIHPTFENIQRRCWRGNLNQRSTESTPVPSVFYRSNCKGCLPIHAGLTIGAQMGEETVLGLFRPQ